MVSEATQRAAAEGTVMASIDRDLGDTRLIIADISRDNAWIAIPESELTSLRQWR